MSKYCYSGYHNKKDSMREEAQRLLKGDTDRKPEGGYASLSAPQFEKRRPYKKGGHAKMKELGVTEPLKPKKPKPGLRLNREEGFYPKYKKGGAVKEKHPMPVRAGNHPMIGTKKKSVKLASATKGKENSSVKAKNAQPYDASHGAYMKKGGKVKMRGK